MNRSILVPFTIPLALVAACASNAPRPVDSSLVARAPAEAQQNIAQLRAQKARLQDEVALAEKTVQREKDLRSISKQEVDLAKAEIEASRDRALPESDDGMAPAKVAEVHRMWAEELVDYHDARIDWAEKRLELTRQRADLVDAEVQLAAAQAVQKLPAEEKPDVTAYQSQLESVKTGVAMAQIDAQAAETKVATLRERLQEVAKAVPEEQRKSWRSLADLNGSLREAKAEPVSVEVDEDGSGSSDQDDGGYDHVQD